MSDKRWLPRLLLAVLTLAGAAHAATPTYQTQTLEGWTVNIDSRLPATNKAATDKALGLLAGQLKEIVRVVPAGPVAQLRKVTLWLSPPYAGQPPRAEYHMSPVWLSQNGRNPAMARGIEISNVLVYEAETQRMPMFVLHELAHAYQDQFLGAAGNAEVQAVFNGATASKLYERVERFNGPGLPKTFERAYAMNNAGEFFAEMTEAFFGRNDYYPYTRDELAKHDPATLAMIQKAWQVTQAPAPQPPPPPQAPATAGIDARCFYRLTTLWRGEGLSLDIINDGKANNTPILANTALVSGQLWKLTPEANGAYRLVTQWRGGSLSLANTANNRPLLVTTAAAPEQQWRVTPEVNGTFRLTNLAQGETLSLDILNDGQANSTPILAKKALVSGQLWKLTPVGACP